MYLIHCGIMNKTDKGCANMLKYVLFDLDGTLLPMDQDVFVRAYFKELVKKIAPLGYEPEKLKNAVWTGMKYMVGNDGTQTNEEVFWKSFRECLGEEILLHRSAFDEFYRNEFNLVQKVCGFTPKAAETVQLIKDHYIKTAVATLPVFPAPAIEARIRWAGVDPDTMEFYTSYETCSYTKPHPMYYQQILGKLDAAPQECLMVGNNVDEDMIARTVGMQVFLLTDDLINEHQTDISVYPNGSFDELQQFILSQL